MPFRRLCVFSRCFRFLWQHSAFVFLKPAHLPSKPSPFSISTFHFFCFWRIFSCIFAANDFWNYLTSWKRLYFNVNKCTLSSIYCFLEVFSRFVLEFITIFVAGQQRSARNIPIYEIVNNRIENITNTCSVVVLQIIVPLYVLPFTLMSFYKYYVLGMSEKSFRMIFLCLWVSSRNQTQLNEIQLLLIPTQFLLPSTGFHIIGKHLQHIYLPWWFSTLQHITWAQLLFVLFYFLLYAKYWMPLKWTSHSSWFS